MAIALGGKPRAYVQDLPSGKPRPITDRGYALPRNGISPDGLWAAGWGDWTEDLYLIPTAGGEPRSVPHTKDLDFVRFSPDGKSFYGVVTGSIPAKVVRVEVATSKRETLKELAPPDRSGVIQVGPVFLTPDGKNYAYGYGKASTSDLYLIEGLK
jgi:hypothetical protein